MFGVLAESSSTVMGTLGSGLLGLWDTVWPYLLMLLGFSVIIFVHELGHFLVAKWADVRVEKFAIGFGKEVVGFTRGETRYCLNFLPLGGYVKMLGQEDFDDKSNELRFNDDPRSFVNKPVGHRMAIVSAGVIMNVMFACLLFMIVFLIGMPADAPRVAFIEPDSPAEHAGLLPGDKILTINGRQIREFKEVTTSIFLAPPHEPLEFLVERNGDAVKPIYVRPDYRHAESTRDIQRQVIGIGPGRSREIIDVGPEIDTSKPDSPRPGDRLVEIAGVSVTDENVSRMSEMLGYSPGPIVVERDNPQAPKAPPQRVEVRIPPRLGLYLSDPRDAGTMSVLGLTPLVRFSAVDPEGRAYLAGIEAGDTVLRWDDRPHPSHADIAASIRDNPERDIPFVIQKPKGERLERTVRPKRNRNGPATIQAVCRTLENPGGGDSGPKAYFASVRSQGIADRAGIETGDVVVKCAGVEHPTVSEFNQIIRKGRRDSIPVQVRKKDGRTLATVLRPEAPGSIDAMHTLVADDTLQIGDIVPMINGRPSPAAESGIPAGARITAVNQTPVSNWQQLIVALRQAAGSAVQLAYSSTGEPGVVSFRVPHCLRTVLGVGPEARILRIDGKETVAGDREGDVMSARYHEGTRRLLTELVGRNQVEVEYRKDLLSPVETQRVDITAEMVDPWLGRITLMAGADLGREMIVLKGRNALDAIVIGVNKTWEFVVQVYQVMHRMFFSRSVSVETMSGPLGILDVGGKIAQAGEVQFLFFLAVISANLAVINFLPLPIVDGGLMIFLLIEKIKGSPVSIRVQVATQMIGIFLIIGAFIFVTYQDALRLWG